MSPIEFGPTQKPVKLPTKNVTKSDGVMIAAWGSTGFNKPVHNNLQKLTANVMLPDTCQVYHSFIMKIYKNEFCILIKKGIGLCKVYNIILYLIKCPNTFNFTLAYLFIFNVFHLNTLHFVITFA